jgi:hypothetical protein
LILSKSQSRLCNYHHLWFFTFLAIMNLLLWHSLRQNHVIVSFKVLSINKIMVFSSWFYVFTCHFLLLFMLVWKLFIHLYHEYDQTPSQNHSNCLSRLKIILLRIAILVILNLCAPHIRILRNCNKFKNLFNFVTFLLFNPNSITFMNLKNVIIN